MFLILEDDQEIHWLNSNRIFKEHHKIQLLEPITRELSPDPKTEFHVIFIPNFISKLIYSIQVIS